MNRKRTTDTGSTDAARGDAATGEDVREEPPDAPGDAPDRRIPIEKLGVMNQLGELGVGGVRERLERVSSFDGGVEAERVKIGFVEWSSLDRTFGQGERMGCKAQLPGGPYGYALVLFSKPGANAAAKLMLSATDEEFSAVSEELARSALLELGGMMANGFFDAWADTFDLRIDVGTPVFVWATERDIVRGILQGTADLGVYIAAHLRVPAHGIEADVYLFPDTGTFVEILNRLSIDRVTA